MCRNAGPASIPLAAPRYGTTPTSACGGTYRRNLAAVRALEKMAADRGITVSQLAIAWTLANPDVHVAIVGARQVGHIEDSLRAVEIH